MAPRPVIAALLAALLAPGPAGAAQVIDRVVAVISSEHSDEHGVTRTKHEVITLTQLDAYLAAHPDLLGHSPTREAREAVRNKLVRERYQQLTLQVLKRLRARAKVRIVDPAYAGADAPLAPEQQE